MAEQITAAYLTARTLKLEVLRQLDGLRLDWADGAFKASGWTTRLGTMTEDSVTVGYYTYTPDPSTWNDGYYRWFLTDTLITTGPLDALEGYVRSGVLERLGVDATGHADVDKTGYSLSSGGVSAIWAALSSALTTTGSIGKRVVDFLTGDIFGRLGAPAGASVSADVAAVEANAVAIRGKTDSLAFGTGGVLANVVAIGNLAEITGTVVANGGNTASSFKTDLTSLDPDHWKDALVRFTSGAGMAGQVKKIVAFDDITGVVQVLNGFTRTPPAGATFLVVNS